MNYTDIMNTAKTKFSNYTINQCHYAINDCHETLKSLGDTIDPKYETKLWAEIDAARDRLMKLLK